MRRDVDRSRHSLHRNSHASMGSKQPFTALHSNGGRAGRSGPTTKARFALMGQLAITKYRRVSDMAAMASPTP